MAREVLPGFEMDLEPDTHNPRVRFNFNNGRTVSIVFRTGRDPTLAPIASLALMEKRKVVETGENEAYPEEVANYLATVAAMPPIGKGK